MISNASPLSLESAGSVSSSDSSRRVPSAVEQDVLLRQVRPVLLLLLRAFEYALDVSRPRWDFAVEIAELRRLGLTTADCRWLACKGWIELARELPALPESPRRFRSDASLAISKRSCLVLTDVGVSVARELATWSVEGADADGESRGKGHDAVVRPRWDRERHELRIAGRLVKQFKLPSPNQERILTALQEENWPARIDDPLPPSTKLDAKQRLHDTIKNLNRHQKHRLIRFMGDGSGHGVLWAFCSTAELAVKKSVRVERRAT